MRNYSSFFKRVQALIIAAAMLLTVNSPLLGLSAFAVGDETPTIEVSSDGKVVAGNYDLTEAEKELLGSGLLVGKNHQYKVPSDKDELIAVDSEAKKITAQSYDAGSGYRWEPVAAKVIVNGAVYETVTLEGGVGAYTYTGNAFSVKVTYELNISVDEDVQSLLLSAPAILVEGMELMADALATRDDIGVIELAMPYLVQLATTGIKLDEPFDFMGMPVYEIGFNKKNNDDKNAIESVLELDRQMTANGGNIDLVVMLNAYNAAESKVQYLLENGEALKAKIAETREAFRRIKNTVFFSNGIEMMKNHPYYTVLNPIREALVSARDALEVLENTEWTILSTNVLKDGMTATEYKALDVLVAKVMANTVTEAPAELKNSLLVATKELQYNMSMFDVNVKVVLSVTDPDSFDVKYQEYGFVTRKLTLAEGATKNEVLAAVKDSGLTAEALAAWEKEGAYVEGKFHMVDTDLPDTLTKDIDYVITVQPNLYAVTYQYNGAQVVKYPYGYVIALPNNPDATKAYDYTVGGTYFAQGSSYRVTENVTIDRTEGKAYESGTLYNIIAGNILANNDQATKSAAILKSGALKGDVTVNYRKPDNALGIVTLDGKELTAAPYEASYAGLSWVPFSYTLANGKVLYFGNSNTVTLPDGFGSVTVTYRLALSNLDNALVEELVMLPGVLSADAAEQLSALKTIVNQRGNLQTFNRSMIGILKGLIENSALNADATKNTALKTSFNTALQHILDDCMGATDLYLLDVVNNYYVDPTAKNPVLRSDSEILFEYYQNYESVRSEIGKFAGLMSQMLGAETVGGVSLSAQDKLDALEALMRTLPSNIVPADQIEEYVGKLTTLETTMNSVYENLSVPNASIDLKSKNLGALVAALVGDGKLDDSIKNADPYVTDSGIVLVANDQVVIKVVLQIQGGQTVTLTTQPVYEDETITASLINTLLKDIENALKRQNINTVFYNNNYNAELLKNLIGQKAGAVEETAYSFSWTYKSFTVTIPGVGDQTVGYADRVISLPASADVAYRYDYYINGVKVPTGNRTLTDSELEAIASGSYKISRQVVFVLRENLINYVDSLNAAMGDNGMVFALVEKAQGEYAIVLKLTAFETNALMSSAMGMATGVVQGAYPYVAIDGSEFFADGKVYLQSMIDAAMNSGMGMDTLVGLVDGNGNIKNMTLPGTTVISGKPMNALGGKLMQTTMQLGTNSDDATTVDFYLTLGTANAQLVELRNLCAGEISQYLDLVLEDGRINVKLTLPQKAYEAFLASLLITGKLDLADINTVDSEIAVSFINEMLIPMFESGVTLETFQNTMAMFGIELNLVGQPGAATAFDKIVAFYTNADFIYDETSAATYGTLSIEAFIDRMDLGVLGDIIAEKQTGITLGVAMGLENLGKDYEALFVDITAAGITNKIGLVTDLSQKLEDIAGTAVIVLLDDVDSDLVFDTTTLLNLNGFTVDGDLVANGKVIVVDSHVQDDKNGTVTGQVSGNAIIVGGEYRDNVAAFVKNGYAQDANGVVTNNYYDIVEDANGNITVELNAEMIHPDSVPEIACLVVDIACDLLFNGYATNYLEIDGNTVYDITLKDMVGLYASSNRAKSIASEVMDMVNVDHLFTLLNTVLDDILDFGAIGEAIADGEPIFEYSIVRKPWGIAFERVADGDYVTASIVSGQPVKEGKFSIVVVGDEDDQQYLADLFTEMGNITTADFDISFDGYDFANANLTLSFTADAHLFVDVSSPDYSVMFSVIVADGIGAPANANLVAGIREFYETRNMDSLSLAFNSLTTSQVITALKNVSRNDSFTAMVASLGLSDVVEPEVVELEALYDRFGKVAAALVRRSDLVGGNRLVGSFLDKDGVISISRENVEKIVSASFRGYTASVDVSVPHAFVGIKFFETNISPVDYTELNEQIKRAEALNAEDYTAESWANLEKALEDAYAARESFRQGVVDAAAEALKNAIDALEKKPVYEDPFFVDGTGTPEVSGDGVYGYKVIYGGKYIVIDVHARNGITVDALKESLSFAAENADSIRIEITNTTQGNRSGLVGSGAVVTATAESSFTGTSVSVSYTIVILGDVNGDGKVATTDAAATLSAVVNSTELSEIQELAANINNNARLDIGDAALSLNKAVYPDEYISLLDQEEEI